ncbi:MAG: molybdate ABC transporter substrate-binding protein [Methylophaga sp.]|nr:molybdate ABC transporter substrate-binding protein [Methylophaga sp.]
MQRWLFLLFGLLASLQLSAETVHIAAAANLRYVLPAIITDFEAQQDKVKIAVTYAASGNLSNQIRHGAPYQVFLSADAESVAPLIAGKLIRGQPFSYADGQLALFKKYDTNIELDLNLAGLKRYLQTDPQQKIAIANPLHAPYGRAAKSYMQHHDVWSLAEPYLVQAENAGQLTQFTLTGNVAVGFIPLSHAQQAIVEQQGRYLKLPVILNQQGILTKQATSAAEQFVAYLQGDCARQHFLQQGFVVPGVP